MVNKDVTCLKAFSSSDGSGSGGDVVCTAGRDGRVVLLDPRSGARVGEVRSGESFSFSKNVIVSHLVKIFNSTHLNQQAFMS